MKIKTKKLGIALLSLAFSISTLPLPSAYAQETSFVYQGELNDGGQAANGTNYGMVFNLFTAPTNGALLDSQTNASVTLSNGLFSIPLDFGNVFDGAPRWLEINVQKDGGPFSALSPRQPVLPTPYSIFASSSSNVTGAISAAQLYGALPSTVLAGAYSGAVGLTNPANSFAGAYSGNGGGLTNLNLSALAPPGTFTLVSNATSCAASGSSFSASAIIGVGANPNWLAAADLNGDGKVDLITPNISGDSLSVILNNGNGTFAAPVTYPCDAAPYSVLAIDVNHDGKCDLVSANQSSNDIEVFVNNGSGVFSFSSRTSVGNSPNALAAGDFNNDGSIDIATPNGGDNTLSVLTNNGSGRFILSTNIPVGNTPVFVLAADINNDSKLDLICVNSQDNTITLLTNNGLGVFVTAGTNSVGSTPYSVAAADINNDGKIDLLVANQFGPSITVLTNTGNGSFVTKTTITLTNYPLSISVADVNGDGKLDLVCGVYTPGQTFPPPGAPDHAYVTILTNDGFGGFAPFQTIPSGGGRPYEIVTNLNNDAFPDIACASWKSNTVVVLTNVTSLGYTNVSTTLLISNLVGDGGGLTNINAANLVGAIPAGALPANLATTDYVNTTVTTASNGLIANLNTVTKSMVANLNGMATNLTISSGAFSGNGSGLTNLPGASSYLYVYDTTTQNQTNVFQTITFNSLSQLSGWTRSGNGGNYTCQQSGLYLVEYDCSVIAFNLYFSGSTEFSARFLVNSNELPGSEAAISFLTTNNVTPTLPLSKTFLAALQSNDVVQLSARDTSGKTALSGSGYGTVGPSVSMTIFRLK